jgi:hypothetical protein
MRGEAAFNIFALVVGAMLPIALVIVILFIQERTAPSSRARYRGRRPSKLAADRGKARSL